MGWNCSCTLVSGAGSCPSAGQGWAKGHVYRALGSGRLYAVCPADGWCCVPALLVVWPEVSQHWSPQAVGWGQVLVRKLQPPWGLTPMSTPQNCCPHCLCPCSEAQLQPASTGDSPILAGKSGSVSYEVTAIFPTSWCTRDLVCAFQGGVSVSSSPVEFLWSNPTGLQSQILWGLLLLLPDPQSGEPVWGSELSLLWEKFWGIIIFQFVGCPLACIGFDFIMIAPLLPYCCGFFFVFACRVFFW